MGVCGTYNKKSKLAWGIIFLEFTSSFSSLTEQIRYASSIHGFMGEAEL